MKKNPNKVLIFTINGDLSTDKVTDWLIEKGYVVVRYNVDTDYKSDFTSFELNKDNLKSTISLGNFKIKIEEIKSAWVRKYFNPNFSRLIKFDIGYGDIFNDIYKYLAKEYTNGIFALIELLMKNKKVLGSKITKQPSKYEMLLSAKKFDIDIPNTLITTKKLPS